MRWFKHDADANMDAKLQEVLLDYGLEGYGLFWYCLELITNKITSENLTFELEHDARIIARNTGSTPQKVEEMMRKFVTLGLFENSHGVITCLKLADRLDKSMTNSPQMRVFIDKLRDKRNVMTLSGKVSPEGEGEGEGEGEKNKNDNLLTKKPLTNVDSILSNAGISKSQIEEIKRIRKKNKGGAITDRVAKTLVSEFTACGKAGWSLDDMLDEWEYRGWKGFKAEWCRTKASDGNQIPGLSKTGSNFVNSIRDLELD